MILGARVKWRERGEGYREDGKERHRKKELKAKV